MKRESNRRIVLMKFSFPKEFIFTNICVGSTRRDSDKVVLCLESCSAITFECVQIEYYKYSWCLRKLLITVDSAALRLPRRNVNSWRAAGKMWLQIHGYRHRYRYNCTCETRLDKLKKAVKKLNMCVWCVGKSRLAFFCVLHFVVSGAWQNNNNNNNYNNNNSTNLTNKK